MVLKNIYLALFITTTFLLSAQNPGSPFSRTRVFPRGREYVAGTFFFTAIDATLITYNVVRIYNNDLRKYAASFGIIAGAAQMGYGAARYSDVKKFETTSAINFGMGFTAIMTSTLRLLKKPESREPRVAFNLFCIPGADMNSNGVGICIRAKL